MDFQSESISELPNGGVNSKKETILAGLEFMGFGKACSI
jgi:hypothetical protein